LENKGGQDQNHKQSKGFRHKKKARAMYAMWSADSDESEAEKSESKSGEEQILNLSLMIIVDEKYSSIDIDVIIASKNITDPITIEALRSVALMKNKEMQSKKHSEDKTIYIKVHYQGNFKFR
jgi:hypothetical protein